MKTKMETSVMGCPAFVARRAARVRIPFLALAALLLAGSAAAGRQQDDFADDDAATLPPQAMTSLQYLDFDARDGSTVIGLTASAPLVNHTEYATGDHLIIEIPGANVAKLEPTAEIGTPEVDVVQAESVPEPGGALARITIRRAEGTQYAVRVDPKNQRRLEITVTGSAPESAEPVADTGRRLAAPAAASADSRGASRPEPMTAEQVAVARAGGSPIALAEPGITARSRDLAAPLPRAATDSLRAPSAQGPGRLVDARVERAADGRTVVRLTSTGPLEGEAFVLDNPPRLVVNLPATVNGMSMASMPVRDSEVLKVRFGQNQPLPDPVTRVVLDFKSGSVPYELVEGPNSLLVALGRATSGPALALLDPSWSSPVTEPVAGASSELVQLPAGRPADASAGRVPDFELRETADSSTEAALAVSRATGQRYESVDVTQAAMQYQGEPISISMKDAELEEVFRLFHKFTGLNIIVDSSVKGKTITLELVDVPWDQALALVLQTNGLGSQLDGNVLRIAPLSKLAAEEQQKKSFQQAQEDSGTLQQTAIPLSYAAGPMAEIILRKSLSTRGDIQVDRRTNTLFVKDLPARLEEIKRLVALIDKPTRQVQIESRIIETTVDFSRATGIRWGFNYIADRAYGNQTGFSFPRSINSDYAVNLPATSGNGTLALSFRNILNTFSLDLTLQALESRGKARVISRPMIVVQNNQRAEISSGFNIPITNTTATEIDVTFVPATLRLNVTPQITADNNVIMAVEVHNDTPGFLVGSNPSIATRNAKTVVAVPDGGTTVIGGIYQVNEGTSSGRVPFLSRIPLLGWLFRNKSVNRNNDELLIFLTPRIQKAE